MSKNAVTMAFAAVLLLTAAACSTPGPGERQATGGASAVTPAYGLAHGVWANDHHFVAPPY